MKLGPKLLMWVFGFLAIGGLVLFLTLFQSSPGPLAAPHARAIPGNFIWSCQKCHADEGLEAGCLSCHTEIQEQYDRDAGYHAQLRQTSADSCEVCHPDHGGAEFPLVSELSWQGTDSNTFTHPHVDFTLTGQHTELTCDQCHTEKFHEPVVLAEFPDQVRSTTLLGLSQECIHCHEDIHKSGEQTRTCSKCHSQDAFKPAPFFNHDEYFVLEGRHAKAACTACHQQDVEPVQVDGQRPPTFGPVKGKRCADCHDHPHRFEWDADKGCTACHKGADDTWSMGQCGVSIESHGRFGFDLTGAHALVECAQCHSPELGSYEARFPNPAGAQYHRRAAQCQGCHQDPHDRQFTQKYPSCTTCHIVDHFRPSTLGPEEHAEVYPLLNGHLAVACNRCHQMDAASDVRQFNGTTTACKVCHSNPHGDQFDEEIRATDCTACHASDFSSFKIRDYTHQNQRAFFLGKGHARANCTQCHPGPATPTDIVFYRQTSTECASCHSDIHRGQFQRPEERRTQCSRCHDSVDEWSADSFVHDRDSGFVLDAAHAKVACDACHKAVPQPDGQPVVQYRPITKRCEDCHGFRKP